MTKTQELLEAVRDAMDGATDYAIAKKLNIARPRLHEYHTGKAQADAYAAAKMALSVGRDPLEVIAEIEAEGARTETQRTFWRGFLSGLARTTSGVVLLLTGAFSMPGQTGSTEAGSASHNGRLRQRPRQTHNNNAALKGGFFWLLFVPMPAEKAGAAPQKPVAQPPLIFSATTFTMQPRLAFL